MYGWHGRNHVAAAICRVEAAVRISLTNPVCTSNAHEWLPNRKTVQPKTIKDLDFNREEFGQRGKKDHSQSSQKRDLIY